jgi:hypothetical protein
MYVSRIVIVMSVAVWSSALNVTISQSIISTEVTEMFLSEGSDFFSSPL